MSPVTHLPDPARSRAGLRRWVAWLLALAALSLLVGWDARARTRAALDDLGFDTTSPEGMLRSDPGLLVHLSSLVLRDAGREEWRANQRIEHPDRVDVPATFTVGQEFLVAAYERASDNDEPIHVDWVRVMAVVAALAAVGVFGAAHGLTGSLGLGLLAAVLWVSLPANHRTIGFVAMREDLALPLLALHLWALTWACRSTAAGRGAAAARFGVAGTLAGLAAGTWHAMGFVLLLEAAAFLAVALAAGRSPIERRGAWALLAAAAACALVVPALREKRFLLAPAACVAGGLALAALPGVRRFARIGMAVGAGALLLLGRLPGSARDLAHVHDLVLAKLVHLGRLPADPSELSFDARLLWQGPFATPSLLELRDDLGWALWLGAPIVLVPAIAIVARRARRARGRSTDAVLAVATLLALGAAALVERAVILPGLVLPIAAAALAARLARGRAPVVAAAVLLPFVVGTVLQARTFGGWIDRYVNRWHLPYPARVELKEMLEAVRTHVPRDEAVAADFIDSTAILAHTGRPIVLQPKWEKARSRRRVEEFWTGFYHEGPDGLRRRLVEDYRCRFLVVDRYSLWTLHASRYLAGLPDWDRSRALPPAGTTARALLVVDPVDPPGYTTLWASRSGRIRLYALDDR